MKNYKKTLIYILCLLFLSAIVVGMRLFIVQKPIKTVDPVTTEGTKATTILQNTTTEAKTLKSTNTVTTTATTNAITSAKPPKITPTTSAIISTKITTTTTKKATTISKITSTTTKATTVTKTTSKSGLITGFESDMLKQINRERSKSGAKPVSIDSNLNKIARIRAKEISEVYLSSHKRPNGKSWETVLVELDGTSLADWTSAGENIAYGQRDVDEIMDAFIASPSHNDNICKKSYTHVGFGCYSVQGVLYWVQVFIGI